MVEGGAMMPGRIARKPGNLPSVLFTQVGPLRHPIPMQDRGITRKEILADHVSVTKSLVKPSADWEEDFLFEGGSMNMESQLDAGSPASNFGGRIPQQSNRKSSPMTEAASTQNGQMSPLIRHKKMQGGTIAAMAAANSLSSGRKSPLVTCPEPPRGKTSPLQGSSFDGHLPNNARPFKSPLMFELTTRGSFPGSGSQPHRLSQSSGMLGGSSSTLKSFTLSAGSPSAQRLIDVKLGRSSSSSSTGERGESRGGLMSPEVRSRLMTGARAITVLGYHGSTTSFVAGMSEEDVLNPVEMRRRIVGMSNRRLRGRREALDLVPMEDVSRLRSAFGKFDLDISGEMSATQLGNSLTKLGLDVRAQDMISLVEEFLGDNEAANLEIAVGNEGGAALRNVGVKLEDFIKISRSVEEKVGFFMGMKGLKYKDSAVLLCKVAHRFVKLPFAPHETVWTRDNYFTARYTFILLEGTCTLHGLVGHAEFAMCLISPGTPFGDMATSARGTRVTCNADVISVLCIKTDELQGRLGDKMMREIMWRAGQHALLVRRADEYRHLIAANDAVERRRLRRLKQGDGEGEEEEGMVEAASTSPGKRAEGEEAAGQDLPKYQNAPRQRQWRGKAGGVGQRWEGGLRLPWLGALEKRKEISADDALMDVLGLDKVKPAIEHKETGQISHNPPPLLVPPNTRNGGVLAFVDSCNAGEVIIDRVPAPVELHRVQERKEREAAKAAQASLKGGASPSPHGGKRKKPRAGGRSGEGEGAAGGHAGGAGSAVDATGYRKVPKSEYHVDLDAETLMYVEV